MSPVSEEQKVGIVVAGGSLAAGVLALLVMNAMAKKQVAPLPAQVKGEFLYKGQPMAVNWWVFREAVGPSPKLLVRGGAGSSYNFYPTETGTYSIVVDPQQHPIEGVMVHGSEQVQVYILEGVTERDVLLTVRPR